MNNKFNVGDKVRVLDGSNIKDYVCGFCEEMDEFVGNVYTVERVEDYGGGAIGYELDEPFYTFDERSLELVKPEEEIILRRYGNEITATDTIHNKFFKEKLFHGDDSKEVAKNLADKMFGVTRKFDVGDIVVGNTKADSRYSFTRRGWVGRVVNTRKYTFDAIDLKNDTKYTSLEYESFDKSKLYNDVVVCVDDGNGFILGKKYTIKDGVIDGTNSPNYRAILSLEDLNSRFSVPSKFIKLIE